MDSSGTQGDGWIAPNEDFNGFAPVAAKMKPAFDDAINRARLDEWKRILDNV